MTSRPAEPTQTRSSADPWWGGDALEHTGTFDAPLTTPAPAAGVRRRRRKRSLAARVVSLPFTLLGSAMRRSPAVRSFVRRVAVIGAIAIVVGGAVGVILVNNLVISRSAELGKLDQERRDLQRENAVLNSQTAKLSAPQSVTFKARQQLGMVESPNVPSYIYLEPCSHQLTAMQRAVAAKATGAAVSCRARPAATRSGAKTNGSATTNGRGR